MIDDPITYKQLDDLLLRLGFTRQRVAPKWLRYAHPATGTEIVLVEKRPSDAVRVTDAVSARRHLVEKGLISGEEIEQMLAASTSVGATATRNKQ